MNTTAAITLVSITMLGATAAGFFSDAWKHAESEATKRMDIECQATLKSLELQSNSIRVFSLEPGVLQPQPQRLPQDPPRLGELEAQ